MSARGKLFLIVGRSGVGKDSVLDGARIALADEKEFTFARRTITRAADAGGEEFNAVSAEEFASLVEARKFFAHWQAHGLSYGLPASLLNELNEGRHVIANVSRAAVPEIIQFYSGSIIIEITASLDTIASRLKIRNRETEAEIAARISRTVPDYPDSAHIIRISNEAKLDDAVGQFVTSLQDAVVHTFKLRRVPINTWRDNICYLHADSSIAHTKDYLGSGKVDISDATVSIRAKVNIIEESGLIGVDELGLSTEAFAKLGLPEGASLWVKRTPSPKSLAALRRKISRQPLNQEEFDIVVRDICENRYQGREISAFLLAATEHLELNEIEYLCRARAKYSTQIRWPSDIVVDKHSMGGVPGSRITMIVIPIVAASGMTIPKTSSRAITSAAGTADAMEVIARVDLNANEVRSVVAQASGCIAWNGALNHSAVDDVMNSITRPLGIDSTKWSVASILSKKLAAGSTHIIIDLPTGPGMKTATEQEAEALARLFEFVGARVGLKVVVKVTDGTKPIGRGIGPALEVRDIFQVLSNDPKAPMDLREKALDFAGSILDWNPSIGPEQGRAKAEELLNSGAALASMEKIVDAQGRQPHPISPGPLVHEVRTQTSGRVMHIDAKRISSIARRAGAPMDKSAGVDLCHTVGDDVGTGETIYRIHGSVEADVNAAFDLAQSSTVFNLK